MSLNFELQSMKQNIHTGTFVHEMATVLPSCSADLHKSCEFQGCVRVSDYDVPKSKIGDVYDMTYVTLDIVVKGEKEKC